MTSLPARTGAVLAALVLFAAAGCGDDGGSSDDGGLGENPSKDAYIAAADEVCQEMYRQRDPLEKDAAFTAQSGDTVAAAGIFENAASVTENRMNELLALPRPEADAELLGALWERGIRSSELGREAAQALRDGDEQAFAAAARQGTRNSSRFNKTAISYGFLVCGRGQAAEIG